MKYQPIRLAGWVDYSSASKQWPSISYNKPIASHSYIHLCNPFDVHTKSVKLSLTNCSSSNLIIFTSSKNHPSYLAIATAKRFGSRYLTLTIFHTIHLWLGRSSSGRIEGSTTFSRNNTQIGDIFPHSKPILQSRLKLELSL